MGIFLNPGNQGFESAIRSQIYVDKTQMLAYTNSVLDTEQRCLCVSRPRRFGKSIAAEMLVAYYGKGCDSAGLFENCKIASNRHFAEHLNQYDVIHIDINSFRNTGKAGESIVSGIQGAVIRELRETFPGCIPEAAVTLREALAGINKAKGTRFIVIIDEWDAVFREDKDDDGAQTEYIDFLRGLFKDVPAKRFIKLAYLTGILPIKKYGTESALNNFDEFTMLEADVLAEYVGFTEAEVRKLCERHGMDFAQTAQWYDGYVLEKGLHVYNPKSVVDSIRRKRIGNYWTNTETYESLKSYISMNFDGLRDAVARMLAGDSCRINPAKFQNDMTSFKSRDDILTLLIHLGYLTYDRENTSVRIPNEEVRGEFVNAIEDAGWKPVMDAINASDRLLEATWRMDAEAVAERIGAVHMANASVLHYNDENSLSCVIALAYFNAVKEYMLIREMPTGKGYADIVFLPRKHSDKPAMIVELKWNRSARGAIEQVKDRKYVQALEDYEGKILLVGINYNKKSKEYQCRIESV
ncbi:MAG: AAA family ATPase [Lachnospiraceae bacterium]|nr:AAA family ATPase [Lachnospiraceae bacterium]